jgi:hypothetical protein
VNGVTGTDLDLSNSDILPLGNAGAFSPSPPRRYGPVCGPRY